MDPLSNRHHLRAAGARHGGDDPRGPQERQGGLADPSATATIRAAEDHPAARGRRPVRCAPGERARALATMT